MEEDPNRLGNTAAGAPRADDLAETQLASDAPSSVPVRTTDEPSLFDPPAPDKRFIEGGELGRGGMGRVFEAHDSALDRPVAIKQSLAHDPAILARFEREVRITAKLQHPGIVPILDAGRDAEGRPYYVMRRIDGRPLAELIAKATTFEARLALVPNVLAAVDACAYAHARRVIHRDIKPWNVLVAPFGETLLIDWGLARELAHTTDTLPPELPVATNDDQLTRAGETYGTPGFMAPEQARGEVLDRRADVFALGATLYHTLTGNRPFTGATPKQALDLAASGEHAAELPPEVPAELRAIVDKAMAIRPRDRYVDAGALAEDLRRYATGQLVGAHRYTRGELVLRWVRRYRIAVAIAALAIGTLVLWVRREVVARQAADAAFARELQRSDEVVLEHASTLVFRDPTRAVAKLEQLRGDDPELTLKAAAIFDSAMMRGVARGRLAHRGIVAMVAASPAGDVVASVGNDGGVLLHDPKLIGPSRLLATIPGASSVNWLDDQRIVVTDGHHNGFLVGRDGSSRRISTMIGSVVAGRDRLLVIGTDSTLRELDVGRGVTLAPIAGVMSAMRLRGALVYATAQDAFYHPDDGPAISLGGLVDAWWMAVSADQTRIAVSFPSRVILWSLESGTPVEEARWEVKAYGLFFIGRNPVAQDGVRFALLSPNKPPRVMSTPIGPLIGRIAGDDCSYVSTGSGGAWELCGGLFTQISGRSQTVGTLALAGGALVGGTSSGHVLSWNTPTVGVLRFDTDPPVRSAFVGQRLWSMYGRIGSFEIQRREYTDVGLGAVSCYSARYAVYTEPAGTGLTSLQLETGRVEKLAVSGSEVSCSRQGRLAIVRGKQIEIRDLAAPSVVVTTVEASFEAHSISLDGDWLAATDTNSQVARFDLRTGESERIRMPTPLAVAIDHLGHVLVVHPVKGTLWTRHALISDLPIGPPLDLRSTAAGIVVTRRDKTLVVIREDGTTRSFRFSPGFVPAIAIDAPIAAMPSADGIAVVNLRDGRVRSIPAEVDAVQLSPDGKRLAGWTGTTATMIWTLPQERSRDDLKAEIEHATNAKIDPDNPELIYR